MTNEPAADGPKNTQLALPLAVDRRDSKASIGVASDFDDSNLSNAGRPDSYRFEEADSESSGEIYDFRRQKALKLII